MKRKSIVIATSILIMVLLAFCAISANASSSYPKGDVNGNEKVDVADAVLLNKFFMMKSTLTSEERERADVCQDGRVNVFDLCCIKSILTSGENDITQTTTTTTTTETTTVTTTNESTTTETSTTEITETETTTAITTTATTETTTTMEFETAEELIGNIVGEIQEEWWDGYDIQRTNAYDQMIQDEENSVENAIYAFEHNGKVYAYSLIISSRPNKPFFLKSGSIVGAIVWEIEGYNQGPCREGFNTVNNEGKTYVNEYDNTVREYDLQVDPSYVAIVDVADFIAGQPKDSMEDYYWNLLGKYDYNLDGELDKADLKHMIELYVAKKPCLLQSYCTVNPKNDCDYIFEALDLYHCVYAKYSDAGKFSSYVV